MEREVRYTVFKIADVAEALSDDEKSELIFLEDKVAAWREVNGKQPLVCAVVESDWPEYEPTWQAVEQRVDAERRECSPCLECGARDEYQAGEMCICAGYKDSCHGNELWG